MPTIAIDSSSAEKPQRTGVEEYSFQIIERLKKSAVLEGTSVVLFSPKTLKWPFKKFWMQIRVTWELWRRPPEVFFVPGQALPFFISKKIKVATTIHDVGFRRYPQLYPPAEVRRQEAVTRRAVRRADIIFTPSEFTETELVELYQAKLEKIVVTPLSADTDRYKFLSRETVEPTLQKYRLGYKNYFLFVSRVELKKNPEVLISAFGELKNKMGFGDPLRLVFAGRPGFGFEKIKKLHEISPVKDFILSLGYVSLEDLPALVNGARALVLPSWYEGFGIPALEAAACGTPVIAADIPPIHEVLGEAGLFVPPFELELWEQAMEKIAKDPVLVSELSQKGLARAKSFSWDSTAQKTAEAINKLLKE